MNKKKTIIIVDVVLALLALFIVIGYVKKIGLFNPPVSPNILYITQPVYTFSGIVEKIEGNKLLISQKGILTPSLSSKETTTFTYQVVVSDKTRITQPVFYPNYLFRTPPPVRKLTINDITVGDMVVASSYVDLRTLTDNKFEATMIDLSQRLTVIGGKITHLDRNTLTLKALNFATIRIVNRGITPPPPQEKEYSVIVTPDTEISYYNTHVTPGTSPKPEKLSLSSLKKDMQVTVYADTDVTKNTKFTALRIVPVIN